MIEGSIQADLESPSMLLTSGTPYGTMGASLRTLNSVLAGVHNHPGSVAATLQAAQAAMLDAGDSEGSLAARLRTAVAEANGASELAAVMGAALTAVRLELAGEQWGNGALDATLAPLRFSGGPKFSVFPSATVLTLSGLNFNLYNDMPRKFQGYFQGDGYQLVKVSYPASASTTSIPRGVAALDAMIRSTSGPIIVLAQSQGAQVVAEWIEQHKDDEDLPGEDELMFIVTGNPLRANGGGYLIGRPVVSGGNGVPFPTDSPWRVIDFARRYDGFADWPTDESNKLAVDNARTGMGIRHTRYDQVALFDQSHTVWSEGNITYVLTAEELPNVEKQWWTSPLAATQMQDKVEQAYVGLRPGHDPAVVVTPTENWYWKWVLSTLGIET